MLDKARQFLVILLLLIGVLGVMKIEDIIFAGLFAVVMAVAIFILILAGMPKE